MLLKIKKGFTLIELLVVIGVLAVIAAGVVALINPQDKLLQANDAKIINDVGQYATALQSFAAQTSGGTYPTAAQGLAYLQTTGELTINPAPPGGYAAYTYTVNSTTDVEVCGQVRSRKYTGAAAPGPFTAWLWCSTRGNAGPVANCAAACP